MAQQIRTNETAVLARMLRSFEITVKKRGKQPRLVWISPTYVESVKAMFALYNASKARFPDAQVSISKLRIKTRIFDKIVDVHFVPALQPDRMMGFGFTTVFFDEKVVITQELAAVAAERTVGLKG